MLVAVLQDYAQAVRWFRKAAEQENVGEELYLGSTYALGRGVPQDYVEAHMWANLRLRVPVAVVKTNPQI
jgi:uncharacterized protein